MIAGQESYSNTPEHISVLLVEDSLQDAFYIQELLSPESYRLLHATSLGKARESIKNDHFDVVLLDLALEDGFGLDTYLSMHESMPNTPIVILTGNNDQTVAIQAIKLGAQDYVQKLALTEKALSRIIRYSIERYQTQRIIDESAHRATKAEAFLKLALKASSTGVWSWIVGDDYVTFDEQMLSLFGVKSGEKIESLPDFLKIVHADDRERIVNALGEAVKQKQEYEADYRIVWDDGSEHYIAARGRVTSDPHSSAITMAGVCTDVTRLKLEQKNAVRLLVLEKHEDFIATLTHDLKNPLIGAERLLELFLGGQVGALDQHQLKLLGLLHESNADMLSLIQNLLEVYRHDEGAAPLVLAAVNVEYLANTCVRQLTALAERSGVLFTSDFPGEQHEITANSVAIGRVLRNLISNAMKFTSSGDTITVSGHNDGDSYILEVKDTGAGMSEEELKSLFQRYSQGKMGKKYQAGTGLGLYLCRQLVEAHGGEISCASKVAVGTSFMVTLPRKQRA